MLPRNIVRSDGTLNDERILKRELIYKGMNGKYVERFYMTPEKSYVFKPLTNNKQLGREIWANEHVLPFFPDIYPKIIASSSNPNSSFSWLIFEDLGPLKHVFNEDAVLSLTKLVAGWHSFPIESLDNIPLKGPKPSIDKIVAEILLKKEDFIQLLPMLQIDAREILHIYFLLNQRSFSNTLVLSHGDLHLGNFAVVNNKMMVIDWEHTHLNTPLWDLYHLIDLSHPLFPKKVTSQLRNQILNFYLGQIHLNGLELNRENFIMEYHLFSSAFSIWMILLIMKDLDNGDGKWTNDQLEVQLTETISNLTQCATALYEE